MIGVYRLPVEEYREIATDISQKQSIVRLRKLPCCLGRRLSAIGMRTRGLRYSIHVRPSGLARFSWRRKCDFFSAIQMVLGFGGRSAIVEIVLFSRKRRRRRQHRWSTSSVMIHKYRVKQWRRDVTREPLPAIPVRLIIQRA